MIHKGLFSYRFCVLEPLRNPILSMVEMIPHGTPQPPRGGTAPDLYTPVARAGVYTRGGIGLFRIDYRALPAGYMLYYSYFTK